MILLVICVGRMSPSAKTQAFQHCAVLERLAGEWLWQTEPPSEHSPRGTFSFKREPETGLVRVQVTSQYPQGNSSSSDLYMIYPAENGANTRATRTSGEGKIATCTAEVSNEKCMLTVTCEPGFPPRLSFRSTSRDQLRFHVSGPPPHHHAKFVPYFSGAAQRKQNHTAQ
jgi:hypothetical protein